MRQRCVNAVRRRIGVQMSTVLDPEDVVHDTFAQVITRTPPGADRGELATERCVIALAECRIREAARRHGRETPLGERTPQDPGAPADVGLIAQEFSAALHRGLTDLRPDHHWIVLLRDWLGASWETVTIIMEQPSTNAARCLYKRARRSLDASIRAGAEE